jgi:hypothetical protein
MMSAKEVRRMSMFIIEGLEADGESRKQWYLEEILKAIAPNDYNKLKAFHGWDDGIAPLR